MLLRRFEYVHQVVKYGTIREAAQQLYVSEPTISQQIQKFEESIGLKVFKRQGRKIQLTDEGRLILPIMQQALLSVKEFDRQVAEIKDPNRGSIRFGLGPIATSTILPDIMADFNRQYPNVSLNVTEAGSVELLDLFDRDQLDISIISLTDTLYQKYQQLENIKCKRFFRSNFSVAMSETHPLAKFTKLNMKDLYDESLILYRSSMIKQALLTELGSEIENNIVCYTDSIEATRNLVVKNIGISILPKYFVNSWSSDQSRGLTFIALDEGQLTLNWSYLYKEKEYHPIYLSVFIKVIQQHVRNKFQKIK
ncbi:LysR family transcriptional regulator [Bacillus dakarensis]|uniref:LysR family transcriptional regulator n=1 Tax=Robertmurraya dakarensis TaxID=1926278 RepID=UPI0009813803|nr:LysR family transcriptional regulator [Bacillus dakarensis]